MMEKFPKLFLITFVSCLVFGHKDLEAKEKWLLTPKEMQQIQQEGAPLKQPLVAREGPGPAIILENPKILENVKSPVDILIFFKPGISGKPPDMASLNVRVIGFIDIDITDRVTEYVSQTNLDITDTSLPVGDHDIGVFIRDIEGNPNERVINVRVVP